MKEIEMMTKIICVMKDTIYCSRPTVNGQRSHVRHINNTMGAVKVK